MREPIDSGVALDAAKARDRVEIESAAKFRFFFVGLVFAILSFAIQYPSKTPFSALKIAESLSWCLLAAAGFLALLEIGGFSPSRDLSFYLGRSLRITMWVAFGLGVVLLLATKIWVSFVS